MFISKVTINKTVQSYLCKILHHPSSFSFGFYWSVSFSLETSVHAQRSITRAQSVTCIYESGISTLPNCRGSHRAENTNSHTMGFISNLAKITFCPILTESKQCRLSAWENLCTENQVYTRNSWCSIVVSKNKTKKNTRISKTHWCLPNMTKTDLTKISDFILSKNSYLYVSDIHECKIKIPFL